MSLRIRAASAADAELLAELGSTTFHETFASENTAEDMAGYLAAHFGAELQARELADPAAHFLIAEWDDVALGYAKLQEGPPPPCVRGAKPLELARLYVRKSQLGAGVGPALMQRCLDEARALGAKTLWLGVWSRNERAIAFYRKERFVEVGEQNFQLGSDAQHDRVLARAL